MDGAVVAPEDAQSFLGRAGITAIESVARVMIPREYVLARLPSAAHVADLEPDMAVLAERFGMLVYAREGKFGEGTILRSSVCSAGRPATGSAAVALATVLSRGGESAGRLSIDQGVEMGHPSRIELSWGEGEASIGGKVVRRRVRVLDL